MYLLAVFTLTFSHFHALCSAKLQLSESPVALVPYEGLILPVYVDAESYKLWNFSNATFYAKPLPKIAASTAHCIYQRLPGRFTVRVLFHIILPSI